MFFSPRLEAILIGRICTGENVFTCFAHEHVHYAIYNILGKWETSLYDNLFNVLGLDFGEDGTPADFGKFARVSTSK